MAGAEKLSAALRLSFRHIDGLNHPAVSWIATSSFWGNFPAGSRAAPVPLQGG